MKAKIIDKNNIEVLDKSQFDIDAIMHSGQVFRFFAQKEGFLVVVGGEWARVLKGQKIIINCSDADFFYNYFDLNRDYNLIKNELEKYSSIIPAMEIGCGIRILRGDFFETVISFIISANNNIKRFTKTLNGLACEYGKKLQCGEYSFPTLQELLRASEEDFRRHGCGYRSAYLVEAVRALQEIDLTKMLSLSPTEQDKVLQGIKGVGAKVSACIRLFALGDLSVCPIDTWIKKAVATLHEQDQEVLLNHQYAGVAQQYIFYYYQYLGKTL